MKVAVGVGVRVGVGVAVAVAVAVGVAVFVGVGVAVGVAVGVGVGVGTAARTEAPKPTALSRAISPIIPMAPAREVELPVRGRKPRTISVAIPATTDQVRCSAKMSSAPCQTSASPRASA